MHSRVRRCSRVRQQVHDAHAGGQAARRGHNCLHARAGPSARRV